MSPWDWVEVTNNAALRDGLRLERPEFQMADIDPATFRNAMTEQGAVLIRSAVPPAIIEPLAAEVEAMMDHYSAIPKAVIARESRYELPMIAAFWKDRYDKATHYNQDLITFSKGRFSLFDVLRGSGLAMLAEQAFPDRLVWENFISNVRRVYPVQSEDVRGDAPLHIHVDAQFHQHTSLGINFWTPLTPAGLDSPGIQVLPLGVERTRKYLDYSETGHDDVVQVLASQHHFRCERMELAALDAVGLLEQFWAPEMDPGDVLAFTNFTMHASYVEAGMTLPRTSIEARVLLHDRSAGTTQVASDPSAA